MADEKKEDKKDAGKEAAKASEKVANTPEQEAAQGKKKKLLLFIIVFMVLLLGGGAGAFFFLKKSPNPASDTSAQAASNEHDEHDKSEKKDEHATADEHAKDAKKNDRAKDEKKDEHAKDSHGKDDKKEASKSESNIDFGQTYQFKPFHLNLGNPLENRYIRLELSVEYKGGDSQKEEIERRLPQLRDAIVAVTSKKTREGLVNQDGKDQLRKEILIRLNRYMSQPIESVYITDMLIE